jgi:hypothetical protein
VLRRGEQQPGMDVMADTGMDVMADKGTREPE